MRTVLIWAVTAFVAISAQKVSTNGRCGPDYGNRVCKGSSYGDCCSQYGWCGSTSGHCVTGCRPSFGTCSNSGVSSTLRSSTHRTSTVSNTRSSSVAPSSTRTSSIAIASPSIEVSKNGRCGYSYNAKGGFTCKGSAYGDCCSQYSYCGSTSAYCGTGCQLGFGTCSGISASVRSSSTLSVRSSSASSSVQSSSASSSIAPVPSSTQVSSSISTRLSSSTSSSIAISSSGLSSSSPTASSSTIIIISSSSIDLSTSTSLSATSQSTISSDAPSSSSVPSSSVTSTDSASSTLVPDSVTSSSASPSSSTPAVTSPTQIVVNPSFELGDGSNPTGWTVERLYIIDSDASGRVQNNARTGSYSIRGRGQPNGGYDVVLSQTVTVVPGAQYNIEVYAKQTTQGFCSMSIYFGNRAIREFVPPGTSYTSIAATIDIAAEDSVQQTLLVDGACSLPNANAEMYDLFIDDVTMTLVV